MVMVLALKEKLFSQSSFWRIVRMLVLGCALIISMVIYEGVREYERAVVTFQLTSHLQALQVQEGIEKAFEQIYSNIRTIAKLPSVRNIDRHAKNLSQSDRTAIQEIYNNLADHVSVSEVYIVPRDFHPNAIDKVTGKTEAPAISFDGLIVGRTGDDKKVEKAPHQPIEEIEKYEYELIVEQIAKLQSRYPKINTAGFSFPAISGHEVVTCDNSRYSPSKPNDADRSGMVYSVPYYDKKGKFAGVVSAISLTSVLQELLPDGNYALLNPSHKRQILPKDTSAILQSSKAFLDNASPDSNLLYSEVITLKVKDSDAEWKLWAGRPNEDFRKEKGNAIIWRIAFICAAILFSAIAVLAVLVLFRRNYLLTQEKLNDTKARMGIILNNVQEGICGLDLKGHTIFGNKAAEEMLGFTLEEMLGKSQHDLIHHHYADGSAYPRERCNIYKALTNGAYHTEDREVFWRKDGSNFPVEYTSSPIRDEAGVITGAVVVFRDITERKKAEAAVQQYATQIEAKNLELAAAKEQAEVANNMKTNFLANMSHEIRTPMNGIIGMAHLLLDTDLDSSQRSYAHTMMHSGEALLEIVNDILDISKIETGKIEFENIPFDIQLLTEEVSDLMAIKAQEKDIELLLSFSSNMPVQVVGDPGRLRQILINLIGNGIKFTEKGHVWVKISGEKQEDKFRYRVEVVDTGIGIPADKLDYIFNKFSQADSSTTRKFGGTGLGLSICRQLCHLMGGQIGVASEIGSGSTFWFELPFALQATAAPMPGLSDINLKGVRILMAEDRYTEQQLIETALKDYGATVEHVARAREAIAKLSEETFDVVLMDHTLPDMDGLTLARRINNPKLKLILITSMPQRGDRQMLRRIGFSAYFSKPVQPKDIAQAIILLRSGGFDDECITRHTVREQNVAQLRPQLEQIDCTGMKILLVEDNTVNQQVASLVLKRLGCVVQIAANGQEAVEAVKEKKFDVILMDCQMPVMDGFEATEIIRKGEKGSVRTPIIAITANAQQGDADRCLAAGMDDYLPKPLKPDEIKEKLAKWTKK